MFEIEIVSGFAAAHLLRDYKGKCEHLHGHNYRVHVTARSQGLEAGGMVIDFTELKRVTNDVLERLDHAFLNELTPFDTIEPSAENIAAVLFGEIEGKLGERGRLLHGVSVWESDTSRATFYRDPAK
ncbi:MAG: 6-carboxytetrahydropterin synthase QueD [Pseudomonadota bacterium]